MHISQQNQPAVHQELAWRQASRQDVSAGPVVLMVNAFPRDGRGGNPAGVVLDADALSLTQMQAIASQVGVSETAFLSEIATGAPRIDFFTPTRRIAHCGHATIAAFSLLRQQGRLADGETVKRTMDGPRRIRSEGGREDGMVFMEQTAPQVERVFDADQARLRRAFPGAPLGLAVVVSTGNRFLLVEVPSEADLAALSPDLGEITALSESLDLIGVYVYVRHPACPVMQASTRMFAPRYGIAEEAATGMAAGPLAAWLWIGYRQRLRVFAIGQGDFMPDPSPSLITVRLDLDDAGEIVGVWAGGTARLA